MKKKLLACLMVIAMIFGALALSSCSIGEVVDKIDSVKNGLESIGENLPWKDSDCKESLGNSEKEPSESSGTTHSHYFERVPSERCLKSSASCTKKAEYYYSCSCGELDSKTFEYGDYEHKEVIDKAIDPTCTETGLTEGKHCSECNKILTAQTELPALGHNIVNHDGKPATCTEKGYEPYETCTRCDYTTYREIPFAEHDLDNGFCKNCGKEITPHTHIEVIDKGTPATCLNQGLTDGKHCSICNKVLESQTVIPALGHDLTSHSGKAATCIEKGWNAYNTCSRCSYTTYREIPALGHDIVSHIGKAATCTDVGYKNYETCSRCTYTTYEELPALGHNLTYHNGKAATCLESGYDAYEECSRCDYTTYEEIPALGHNYVNGKCMRCGAGDEATYSRDGNYVYFGSYPQTKVSNETLINTLNSKAGKLPTKENNYLWTSYKYYLNGSIEDYMWYIDKEENNSKYRGVYFTSYRPCYFTSEYSIQSDNGYYTSNIYWFKYEPVKWRVLIESGNRVFLMCDIAIDSQQYYHNNETRTIDGKTVYANNYAESDIRKWLNEIFYNAAFDDLQKKIIRTTSIDNSARSSIPYCSATYWNDGKNEYICKNTDDKVFLLSQYELSNSAYSFNIKAEKLDTARQLKSSDYAKSQGCGQESRTNNNYNDYKGNCLWWSRSPSFSDSNFVRFVGTAGASHGSTAVDQTPLGVVPALWLDISGTTDDSGDSIDSDTYTREGNYIYFGSYPQTKVSDETLINTLNAKADKLPTIGNDYLWTSYGYYAHDEVKNYMWYIDENVDSSKYRGVYFMSYRGNQDDNGYSLYTVYWFKYEPIKWRVLTESGNRAFLMCDIAIDSQKYYHDYNEIRTIDGKTVYPNNYAESEIRKWLNETFYNTAFNDLQKAIIRTTSVDNSARSTNPFNNATCWNNGENEYACENTLDKVFLLSEYEVTNPTYGFSSDVHNNSARQLKSSDYAKSQGCYNDWWLRSSFYESYKLVGFVIDGGRASNFVVVYYTSGIVPALWIAL